MLTRTIKLFTSITFLMLSFVLPNVLVAQNCTCNAQIDLIFDECVSQSVETDAALFIYSGNRALSDSIRWVKVYANDKQIMDKEIFLSPSGLYTETFKITPTKDVKYYVEYHCKKNVCYSSFSKVQLTIPTYNLVTKDISCFGKNDGEVSLAPNDKLGFDIIWESGEKKNVVKNMPAGLFAITVLNSNGCKHESKVKIDQPTALKMDEQGVGISCNSEVTNYLALNVSGGTHPYVYDWDVDGTGDFDDEPKITFLDESIKNIVVKDANGCTVTKAIKPKITNTTTFKPQNGTLHSSTKMDSGEYVFDLNKAVDISNGDMDQDGLNGTIFNISFFNSNADADAGINPLPPSIVSAPGVNIIAKIENNDCVQKRSLSLLADEYCLLVSEACDNSSIIELKPITCDGLNTALPSGGTFEVFQFISLTNTEIPEPSRLVFSGGKYYFDPTSGSGNYRIYYTVGGIRRQALFDVQALNPQVIIQNDPICGNVPTFRVRVNPIGGTFNGPGVIGNIIVGSNQFYIVNPSTLAPGQTYVYTYQYTQSNASGLMCTKSSSDDVTISNYPTIKINDLPDNLCELERISLDVNVSSVPAVTYEWFAPNNRTTPFATTKNASIEDVTISGFYRVKITQANNCFAQDSQFVEVIPLPDLKCNVNASVSCFGGNDAKATVDVLNATNLSGYTFNWGNGIFGQNQTSLSAGKYLVTVTNNRNCSDTCSVEIKSPSDVTINCEDNIQNVKCNGQLTGSNTIIASGGVAPYTYRLNNGPEQNFATFVTLPAANYKVFVKDANGCLDSCAFSITQPNNLTCSISSSNLSCFNSGDGSATVNPIGGTLPFRYLWSNGATTQTIASLSTGFYTVTVTDVNNCPTTCFIQITQPAQLKPNLTGSTICLDFDTFVTSKPTGGTSPYNYAWSLSTKPASTGTMATLANVYDNVFNDDTLDFSTFCLKPGTVTLIGKITDSRGCTSTDSTTIVMRPCFDLALVKKVTTPKVYYPGDLVSFTIDIFNQGTVDAQDITVEDILDQNMQFNLSDNTKDKTGNEDDWVSTVNGTLETVISSLPAGTKKSLTVFLIIKDITTSNAMINFAEIIEASSVLNGGKIKLNPIDEDDFVSPDPVTKSTERDDELCDNYNDVNNPNNIRNYFTNQCQVGDDPNDEDRIDYATVIICQLDGVDVSDAQCVTPSLAQAGFSINTIQNYDLLDPTGNGDGSTADGDTGNKLASMHNTYKDAMDGTNPITGKIKFSNGNGGQNSSNGMVTGNGDLIVFGDQSVQIFGRLVSLDNCVGVSTLNLDFAVTPVITTDIQSKTVILDEEDVCLKVIADPSLASSLKYQWQILGAGGFTDIPGANAAEYCIDVVTVDYDQKQFRVLVSDATATNNTCAAFSSAARISLIGDPILACNNLVNISLDDNCQALITPQMILEDPRFTNRIKVVIKNQQGVIISNPITSAYVGQTLNVSVIDTLTGNSCWSLIKIEDKLPPVISCPLDYTVSCANYTYNPPVPNFIDACDNTATISKYDDVFIELGCNRVDGVLAIRELTYVAKDKYGNVSKPCTFRVYYQKIDVNLLTMPANLALTCKVPNTTIAWDKNNNNYPDPSETGVPKSGIFDIAFETAGNPKTVTSDTYCRVNVTFNDQKISLCGNTFKIVREWTIIEWCTGGIIKHNQIISVKDDEGPVVVCAPDQKFSIISKSHECSADFKVPAPIRISDCNETSWTVAYLLADNNGNPPDNGAYITDNVVFNGVDYYINDLPVGRTWLRFSVIDACDNLTYCFTEVDVIDKELPTPVCDETTVISLDDKGRARLYAKSVDDGSHDNCSKVTLGIRRLSNSCGIASDAVFVANYNGASYYNLVDFCCADQVNNAQEVELLVIDASGNMNSCVSKIEIQQKTLPILICPGDITLDCDAVFTPQALNSFATFTSGCPVYFIDWTDSESSLTCGEKNIRRTWAVKENGTNKTVISCTQNIYIRNLTPFNLNSVIFPSNVTLTNQCNIAKDFGPDNPLTGGYPKWTTTGCSEVAASFIDQVFEDVDDACFRIIRHWSVIDWCTYDVNKPATIINRQQVISIIDTEKPTIACKTETFDASVGCSIFVTLTGQGSDVCTPAAELTYTYSLDGGPVTTGSTFARDLNVGIYNIVWTVTDKCDNSASCAQTIIVRDVKKPTPYCFADITTVVMPSTLSVAIWAKDYDRGATDNCTAKPCFTFGGNGPIALNRKHYYKSVNGVSEETTETEYNRGNAELWDPVLCSSSKIYDCDSLGLRTLKIYVWDAAGNNDFCTVKIRVQDNTGNCGLSRAVTSTGTVKSLSGSEMEDIAVIIEDKLSGETLSSLTDTDGNYLETGLVSGVPYSVKPENDINPLNGVSTLDMVMIQRHILGVQTLSNKHLILAADATNDKKVTAADLTELRKLILGISNKFTNNTSWKFIYQQNANASYGPWDLEEKAFFTGAQHETYVNDFVGVKIGDVSMDAKANAHDGNTHLRSTKSTVIIDERYLTSSQVQNITVRAGDIKNILGLQTGFIFEKGIEVQDVISGLMDINKNNFTISKLDDGKTLLKMSWNTNELMDFTDLDILFNVAVKTERSVRVSDAVSLSSDTDYHEIVSGDLNANGIQLRFKDFQNATEQKLKVYQNIPNPFSDYTTIRYFIPSDDIVDIKITDTDGKLILQRKEGKIAGNNELLLSKSTLENRFGILLLTVSTSKESETIKMIMME